MAEHKDDNGTIRNFESGANRDTATGKLDFEGFLSPKVMHQFAKYMNMHRLCADGSTRDSDNWQKGIPKDVYMKSVFRHFFDMWFEHRGFSSKDGMMAAMCGLLFNVMGYMHETLKENVEVDFDGDEPIEEIRERKQALIDDQVEEDTEPLTLSDLRELVETLGLDPDEILRTPAEMEELHRQWEQPTMPPNKIELQMLEPMVGILKTMCVPPCLACGSFCTGCKDTVVCDQFHCETCAYAEGCTDLEEDEEGDL